jgi:hypothetical protein
VRQAEYQLSCCCTVLLHQNKVAVGERAGRRVKKVGKEDENWHRIVQHALRASSFTCVPEGACF